MIRPSSLRVAIVVVTLSLMLLKWYDAILRAHKARPPVPTTKILHTLFSPLSFNNACNISSHFEERFKETRHCSSSTTFVTSIY